MKAVVREELEKLQRSCPHSRFVMLNSLAAGADTVCAQEALSLGMELVCPLPMEIDEYRKDFAGPEIEVFEHLIEQASDVFIAPATEPFMEGRDFRYREAGLYVALHSHVLLALWDGKPATPEGCGTAEVVSFMLDIKGRSLVNRRNRRADATERYAENSVLREGVWIKIRIPKTGIYQLTDDLIKKAGFTSLNKVKIYGYGGGLQPEKLTEDYLIETDDLKELPTCEVDGKKLFYGIGPVTWDSDHQRVRNPYSDFGYYFLTENDEEADVLNVAMFGMTAKQWREANPDLKGNIRDYATINELICLSNMENINAVLINDGMPQGERLVKLNQIAIQQMQVLEDNSGRKLLK